MACHRGSCHCGAITFQIDATIEELTICDCSLCRRKNALMAKVHERELRLLGSGDLLAGYQWNTHRATHFFCSRCGVYTFHRKRAQPDHFGVNVYCLEDFDIAAFRVRATDGAGMSVIEAGARPEWLGPRERG